MNIQKAVFFIDVSHHQGEMDWELAYKNGVRLALIRASDGLIKDREVDRNAVNSRKLGIKIGFYHYFRPNISAEAQFKSVVSITKPYPTDYYATLDVESPGAFMSSNLPRFLSYMKSGSVYTRTEFWRSNVHIPHRLLDNFVLHLAAYGSNDGKLPSSRYIKDIPKPWTKVTAWQYTDKGDGKKYGAGGSWAIDYNLLDHKIASFLGIPTDMRPESLQKRGLWRGIWK